MRICSLLPSATEIAFALGLGDAVVGVTHECDYPPQAKQKPVVVRSGDMLRDIERVGEAAARQSAASSLIESLRERIHFVTERAKKSAYRPRVACLEWLDPLYNAGHWIPEMVELAGGTAGLAEKGKPSTKIEWERVIEFAPEVIVLMPCGFDVERTLKEAPPIQRLPGWKNLPAVKQGQVFAVNGHAYFSRSGPRLVDGLEILAHILHPELFPGEPAPDAAQRLT